jgi:hypothetical protein
MAFLHASHSLDLPGYRVAVCRTAAEIQACRQVYQSLVEKPEYGVVVSEKVKHDREPRDDCTWIGAWEEGTGRLVGIVRLDESVDLSRYANLSLFAQQYRQTHRVVEVGAHLFSQGRARATVFEGLCPVALSYLLAAGITGVSIHVPSTQVKTYTALGFQRVTAPFQSAVIPTWWQGMLLCLETLPVLWAEPVFQQSWRRQTGVPLRVPFWQRVMRRLPDVQIRIGRRLVVDVVTEKPAALPGQKNSKKP